MEIIKKNLEVFEEWEVEPNELQFEHEGLKCLVLRMETLGHLCGYVGVKELPKGFDECEIDVHGGVTFNAHIDDCNDIMKEYFNDCNYVIGFDTAHYIDLSPKMQNKGGIYRNIIYVRDETIKLAEQLTYKKLQ